MSTSTSSSATTASSSSASPSSTSSSSGGSTNIFTSGDSSPLIVAFFAIGLFVASMIALFGWRRVRRERIGGGLIVRQVGPPRRRKRALVLGDKPALWDLWTKRVHSAGELSWDKIMPMSAQIYSASEIYPLQGYPFSEPPYLPTFSPTTVSAPSSPDQAFRPSPPSAGPEASTQRRRPRLLDDPSTPSVLDRFPFVVALRRYLHPDVPLFSWAYRSDRGIFEDRRPAAPARSHPLRLFRRNRQQPNEQSASHATSEALPASYLSSESDSCANDMRLQVAVTIVMPSPRDAERRAAAAASRLRADDDAASSNLKRSVYSTESEDMLAFDAEEDGSQMEYCIGLMDAPWDAPWREYDGLDEPSGEGR